jgi:hypothetical protein
MTTKLVGLIFILLVPALIFRLYPNWKRIGSFAVISFVAFLIAFVSVWQTHFALGKRIVPELNDNGYYQASPQYKQILAKKTSGSIWNFPVMIRDSMKYVTYYNKGVPRLDLCKPDENGSPFYFWPFGARSINYRWENVSEGVYRYLFLQSNPVAWGLGLLGVIFAFVLLAGSVLIPSKEKIPNRFLLTVFLGMYASYMIAISTLHRVMYLYHYFTPLLFSFILFGLVASSITQIGKHKITENARVLALTFIGLLIFASYQFYRPFSYYEPISDKAVEARAIVPLWELSCVRCNRESSLVVPVSQKND